MAVHWWSLLLIPLATTLFAHRRAHNQGLEPWGLDGALQGLIAGIVLAGLVALALRRAD